MTTQAQARRRFWKDVSVIDTPEGYVIALDGKPIKVPSKRLLAVPSRPLAEAVADEWHSTGEVMNPLAMPMTQLANTWMDRIQPLRAEIIAELLNYVEADLLCYRAADPDELVLLQAKVWQPVVDWAEQRYGQRWVLAAGVMPATQPAEVHAALAEAIHALDDFSLTALQLAASVVCSLITGLAMVEGRITAEEAYQIAVLDETYQNEQWGEDYEAIDRRANLRAELLQAEKFLILARAN